MSQQTDINSFFQVKKNEDPLPNSIDIPNQIEEVDTNLETIIEEESKIELRDTVDWGYHCIKYQTFYFNVILNIINNKQHNLSKENSHLFVKLSILSRYSIKNLNVKEYYKFLSQYQYKNMPEFPLCKISDKPEYIKYHTII